MNRLFEPDAWTRDADIAHALKDDGVECRGFNGSLMAKPGSVLTGSGGPYKVFTPFKNALLARAEAPPHTTGPRALTPVKGLKSDDIDDWGLRPTRPDWSTGFDWTPGEAAAVEALHALHRLGAEDLFHRPRPSGGGRRQPPVPAPALGRGPSVAGDRGGAEGRRRRTRAPGRGGQVRRRDRLARVLGPSAAGLPTDRRAVVPARVRRLPLARRRQGLPGLDEGSDRLSDRGRRHAPAVDHRLDAQPGADDRGVLPREGPADRLAPGRGLVLGHAGGRRPRQQRPELAVGRWLGRRRLALLPHLQSDGAGPEVRCERRLCPPRNWPPCHAGPRRRMAALPAKWIHAPWTGAGGGAGRGEGQAGQGLSQADPRPRRGAATGRWRRSRLSRAASIGTNDPSPAGEMEAIIGISAIPAAPSGRRRRVCRASPSSRASCGDGRRRRPIPGRPRH
jgi:hypothetical protein